MQVQTDVDAVLPAELHGLIDLAPHLFVEFAGILRVGPTAIVQRQADEIKSPFGHHLKVRLNKRGLPGGLKLLQQIESAQRGSLRTSGTVLAAVDRPAIVATTPNVLTLRNWRRSVMKK